MSKPDNPPAFPHYDSTSQKGMTLRDYFAGQAMQTLLMDGSNVRDYKTASREAYKFADYMLKEREK